MVASQNCLHIFIGGFDWSSRRLTSLLFHRPSFSSESNQLIYIRCWLRCRQARKKFIVSRPHETLSWFQIVFDEQIKRDETMKLILFVVLTLVVASLAEDKLQIGIKKKVENCEKKSRKGDRLHMHYTVRLIRLTSIVDDRSSLFLA